MHWGSSDHVITRSMLYAPMFTCATILKKLLTVINGGCSFPFCPRSFDRAVMVASWYDARLETWETRVQILIWASCQSGHVTTRSMYLQRLRSPILTFAAKKLTTGANGRKSKF